MIRKGLQYMIFTLLLVLNVHGFRVYANFITPIDPTAEMTRALSSNDARLLGLLMDDMVTLSLKNKVNIYSKTQAQKVVNDFFESEKDAIFKLQKQGSDPNSQIYYGIGTYKTKSNTYRVYYLLKYSTLLSDYVLKELKIDKV